MSTSFAEAVKNTPTMTFTENGMRAFESSLDSCVDLFFKVGASRKDPKVLITPFAKAYGEDKEVATRILLWARDIRGGSGERGAFRQLIQHMAWMDRAAVDKLITYIPVYGRWDDLLVLLDTHKESVFETIATALRAGDGLCAKWMPRKGKIAVELREYMGLSPKRYRKLLVENTKVVEQAMCSKNWDGINFEHVPSLASLRYKKAFTRNAPSAYAAYTNALSKGEAKVNAQAVFPHQIVSRVIQQYGMVNVDLEQAMWDSLPDYMPEGASIIPVVDVSGSMLQSVDKSGTQALHVSIGLGMYLADKNKGPFKDLVLTFSANPKFHTLKGNLAAKVSQLERMEWGGNTNIAAAIDEILKVAVRNKLAPADMPKTLLILSDMQFDSCASMTGMQMIERKYAEAGYKVPNVVFWNLADRGHNFPTTSTKNGAALVSGFSPAVMKSILATKSFTPRDVMLEAVMDPRYDLPFK